METKIIGKGMLVAVNMFVVLMMVSSATAVPVSNSARYKYESGGIEDRARLFLKALNKVENSRSFKELQRYCDKHFTPEQKAEAQAKVLRLKIVVLENITTLGGDCGLYSDFIDKIALFDSNVLSICVLLVGPFIGAPIAIAFCFIVTLIPICIAACECALPDSLWETLMVILAEASAFGTACYIFGIVGGIIAFVIFLIIDIGFFICVYPVNIILSFIQIQSDILTSITYPY